jgi:pilus assembly protein TadC
MVRILLFLLPDGLADPLSRRMLGVGNLIARYAPNLGYDLREIQGPEAHEYAAKAVLNALAWALLLFLLVLAILFARGSVTLALVQATAQNLAAFPVLFQRAYPAVLALVVTSVTMFTFFLYYPRILARKLAESVDKDLVFALKDLLLQLSSGVTLFNALVNVANAGYGSVSKHFDLAVKDINAGEAIDRALEKVAARTESEFMRRAVWQMVTALRGGASLEGALRSVIEVLRIQQATAIKRFSGELNLWSLLYLIFAVAVPGLGSTVLIVVSAFGGVRVSEFTYITIVSLAFIVQILIVGLVKSRRPAVQI